MKYVVLLLLLTGCFSKSDSPEGVLKDFVEARLERIVGRDFLTEHTTGKMRVSIEAMNDEEFGKFSDLSSYKKDSFKIISKSCQEKRCYLTYSLGYRKRNEGKTTWTSEVKKIAEVLWIEGKWLISDVSNIKTYHETSESIEVNP